MRTFLLTTIFVIGLPACKQPTANIENVVSTQCTAGQFSQAEIRSKKSEKFHNINNETINKIALDLRTCIGHPDPAIRDGLVYESLSGFLRNEQLTDTTKLALFETILGLLNGPRIEPGYTKPFAALNMSELARADRVLPYLSDEQREILVQTTASYMTEITDYRGFINNEGWRHSVAHTADIILQLCLNEKVTKTQLRTLLIALGSQIAPTSDHAYIHGEPERLARAILYIANRDVISADDWQEWFEQVADPTPLTTWGDAYSNQAGLAKLHNTKAFLSAIYINATETKNTRIKVLLMPSRGALLKLP